MSLELPEAVKLLLETPVFLLNMGTNATIFATMDLHFNNSFVRMFSQASQMERLQLKSISLMTSADRLA